MKDVMNRMSFIKYFYFLKSNILKLISINIILLIPLFALVYGLINIFPYISDYFNSMNLAVLEVSPSFDKIVFVVLPPENVTNHAMANGDEDNLKSRIYAFKKEDFRYVRRYIFSPGISEKGREVLAKRAIGYAVIPFFGKSVTIKNKDGKPVATVWIDDIGKDAVEVSIYKRGREWNQSDFINNTVLFLIGLIMFGGMLGGVAEYVQRMVYHESRNFFYIFRAIAKSFFKSLIVFLFLFIIITAVAANIYFYIFIVSNQISVFIAALNIWMLVFFIFILIWIYPLMSVNVNESIWRLMKKSLFLSFDNFEYTADVLVMLIFFGIVSLFTGSLIPGTSGFLSLLSSSLKEISARYSMSG